MAKSINVSGRMSVGRFEDEFQKIFGVRCNVKLSKWRNADNKATLASIRPKDFDAPKKVSLPIVGNMTVRTLKKRFEASFGVMIELYVGRRMAPDNVTISAIREGRVDLSKKKKVEKVEEEVELTETKDNSSDSSLIKIEIYFEENVRVVNILDVSYDKKLEASNFDGDQYYDIISDEIFLKNAKKSIEESKDWKYDFNQTDLDTMGQDYYDDWDEQMNFQFIKNGVDNGDPYMVRIVGVDDLDLSFLSASVDLSENKNEKHESFLKDTGYETNLDDDDFEDNFNAFMNEDKLLSLEHILSFELNEDQNDSIENSNDLNKPISLSDEQIKEFKEREKEADYMGDYLYLAEEVGEAGDLQWAKKLLEVSFQKTEYLSDYISVAECVLKYDLGNDFAISCYKKAEDLATDFDDFNSLAKSILPDEDYGAKRLGDKEWGLRLVRQAENLEDKDYSLLVSTIEEYLEDKDWCVKLLKEWESTDDLNCYDYQDLAGKIENNTNDEDWLLSVYKKAIPEAEDTDDCISIAGDLHKTFKGTEKYDDSMITIIEDLYNEALAKAQEFNDYNKICEKYFIDKEYDDLVMTDEVFSTALEKAMELVFSGEDYEQESFIETLEGNGYTDKAKEIKDKLSEGISVGIVHNIDIDGNSTFLCAFDIDYAYYEEQTGDGGPERFSFEYDFEKGIILKYDYENAELESIKIPYEYEDSFESCWSLMQGENYIDMQGESVSDEGGEQSNQMVQIVETLDQYEFKKLANAVLSKVKDIEGVD
tara:strand:+ start:391 stop:2685 length:2295 start_codon:yes stop_codon:yes gene_type:complete